MMSIEELSFQEWVETPLTYPVMHLQLCGCRQSDWPPLFGPLRGVDGKGVFIITSKHWNQNGDLIDESVMVLVEGERERE